MNFLSASSELWHQDLDTLGEERSRTVNLSPPGIELDLVAQGNLWTELLNPNKGRCWTGSIWWTNKRRKGLRCWRLWAEAVPIFSFFYWIRFIVMTLFLFLFCFSSLLSTLIKADYLLRKEKNITVEFRTQRGYLHTEESTIHWSSLYKIKNENLMDVLLH